MRLLKLDPSMPGLRKAFGLEQKMATAPMRNKRHKKEALTTVTQGVGPQRVNNDLCIGLQAWNTTSHTTSTSLNMKCKVPCRLRTAPRALELPGV